MVLDGRRLIVLAIVIAALALVTLPQARSDVREASGAPGDIQPFDAVDVITCFGSIPNTSLGCPGTSANISNAGSTAAAYTAIKAPVGTRGFQAVSYVPADWALAANASGGTFTMRTDFGCDGGPEIGADPTGSPSASTWPNGSGWNGIALDYASQAATGTTLSNPYKPTPNTFLPLSYSSATITHLKIVNGGNATLPNPTFYPGLDPVPVQAFTEESPYVLGLKATFVIIGDPTGLPNDDFPCQDTPYDQVIKNTQFTAPGDGLYPRWTVITSVPDIVGGTVTKLTDVQCVRVGSASITDTNHNCIDDSHTDVNGGYLAVEPTAAGCVGGNNNAGDCDDDGVVDGVEIASGSSPTNADGDDDGATDFEELLQFTDPNNPDTDGDGSLDKQDTLAGETGSTSGLTIDTFADDNCPTVYNPGRGDSPDQTNNDALGGVHSATGTGGVVLRRALLTSDATATVESTTGFPSSGTFYIDGEAITYTGTTSTTFTGLGTHTQHWPPAVVAYGTTLSTAIDAITTAPFTLAVGSSIPTQFPSAGVLVVDGEFMHYTSTTSGFAVDARALGGAGAAAHASGAKILQGWDDATAPVVPLNTAGAPSGLLLVDDMVGTATPSVTVTPPPTATPPPNETPSPSKERIRYTSKSGTTTFAGVTRGSDSSLAQYHGPTAVYFMKHGSNVHQDVYGDACDIDDDNDGLPDVAELALTVRFHPPTTRGQSWCAIPGGDDYVAAPTDPLNADTDGDGVLDGAECLFGSNPRNALVQPPTAIPGEDTDSDGLFAPGKGPGLAETFFRTMGIGTLSGTNDNPDGDAFTVGTSDIDSDSASKKLHDGVEVKRYGSWPSRGDSDGDGCSDPSAVADFNGDRTVNPGDQSSLSNRLLFGTLRDPLTGRLDASRVIYDLNGDGAINPGDQSLQGSLLGACASTIQQPPPVETRSQ